MDLFFLLSLLFLPLLSSAVDPLIHQVVSDGSDPSSFHRHHFSLFQAKFNKAYSTQEEHDYRLSVFAANMRRAKIHQAEDPSAVHGVTKFSDLTPAEFRRSFLGLKKVGFPEDARKAPILPTNDLPEDFDWRDKGAVAPVKNQYKGSSDKRGWSFRNRSARHRVLSNTVEALSSLNKEIPEIVTNNLETQPKETFIEKTTVIASSEETPQPNVVISKVSDATVVSVKEELTDVNPDESVIVVIQAAVRGFLAKRQMGRVKNVVKLQAAVRGHLVRNHAVGTLRCVQAIVKMQGLVRARQARTSSEIKPLDKETSVTKPRAEYISIEKLLTNKFAHQLLESRSKTKQINIKCDPSSKSDSAWSWLERWMLISSKEAVESPFEGCESTNAKDNIVQTTVVDENSPTPSSVVKAAISDTFFAKEISPELISNENKKHDPVSEIEPKAVSSELEMEIEQPSKTFKRATPEEVESEGKRVAFGTRKASNPAFIAVQSKFEEASAASSLARSTSAHQSNSEAISSSIESEFTRREVKVGGSECGTELSITSALDSPDGSDTKVVDAELEIEFKKEVKVGGSECGTELSITSALDSPDGSDTKVVDAEMKIEFKKEESGDSNICNDLDEETKADPDSVVSNFISLQPEKVDNVIGADAEETAVSVATVASELEEQDLDTKESNEKIELSIEPDHQASAKSSPKASQTIVSDFQVTPSSQVSVKTKRTKSDKKRSSNQKTKSSPSNPNQNSNSKNSLDGFPQTVKCRNSFGSGKSDYADQKPRDSSSSSNMLPSYMQSTESAKMKVLTNSSPRSSPDVLEREVHVKKRHSLPDANGKQDSPRLHHSKSLAHPVTKGNRHSQERKWQR